MSSLDKRYEILQEAENNPHIQSCLYELCRRDPVFYINNFCYTYDPRFGKGDLPFNLYPSQEWFIRVVKERIDAGVDIDIEKSRAVGASCMIMALFQWYFIFVPSSSFMVGSIVVDDVDMNLVDPEDTLFGKLRHCLQFQPKWIIHPDDYTDKYLTLKNHKNGNSITGKASTPKFGRSKRKKAILFDEAAFWQWLRPAYHAASQTTPCRILISTPNGKSDLYGQRMTEKGTRRLIWPGRAQMLIDKGL